MIRHILRNQGQNGSTDSRATDLGSGRVVVGRGGASTLLLRSRMVSLEHAILSEQNGELIIEDTRSISGTRVNSVTVSRQVLKSGDEIRLGDVALKVESAEDGWNIIEEQSVEPKVDLGAVVTAQVDRLDIRRMLPSYRSVSIGLGVVVVALFLLRPLIWKSQASWSSGPISAHHQMIERQCQACHAEPFKHVQDEQCLACHALGEHASALTKVAAHRTELNKRCGECHLEHNGTSGPLGYVDGNHHGPGLIIADSRACTECHGNIKKIAPDSSEPDVTDFTTHPQFSVTLTSYTDTDTIEKSARVKVDDKAHLSDPTPLKLNHKIHLAADLRGENGPTTLHCNDCHHLAANKRTMEPITMERNCAKCHPLNFDERLPKKEVPHGDPRTVFNYLYAEYAKLFLAEQGTIAADVVATRFLPGRTPEQRAAPEIKFTRTAVLRESRQAEKMLFEKTACQLCHVVGDGPGSSEKDAQGVSLNNYEVKKPHFVERWMPGARFDHGAHQELTCESCHEGVRDSEKTSDVLMPAVARCQSCHVAGAHSGKVSSECITCHSYHDSAEFPVDKKRPLKAIVGE